MTATWTILERESVTTATTRLLEEVQRGNSRVLFVVGHAGMGKTASLDHARQIAAPRLRVGVGRGDPMETSLPFGLISQAIEALGGHDLLEPDVAILSAGDRRAVQFHGVVRWLRNAARTPMLLALDDIHWADADSLTLLSFLCRRIGPFPVAVIATLRPWPPAAQAMAAGLVHTGHATAERLAPLSRAGAAALVAARIGHLVPANVVQRALELCAGNPLLLQQVALAIGRGEGVPARGWWPRLSDELLLARFAGIPSTGLRCAQAASVLGIHFRAELAAEIAQLDENDADGAFEALCRSGLLRSGSEGVLEFIHPLFHQALYDDLAAPLRARFHGRAFAALTRVGRTLDAAEHAVRGHLSGIPEAITVLHKAGTAAMRHGALATAARYLGAAVEFADRQASLSLLLAQGEVLIRIGRPHQAAAVFERVLVDREAALFTRVHALRMLGRGLFLTGAHGLAAKRWEEAIHLAAVADPGVAAEVLVDQAHASWLTDGPATSLPLSTRARALAPGSDDGVRRRAEGTWGFMAFLSGDATGLETTALAARAVEAAPLSDLADLGWTCDPLCCFSFAARIAERFDDAERTCRIALQAAEQVGAEEAIASLSTGYAYTLTRLGRLDEALVVGERAHDLSRTVAMIGSLAGGACAHILLLMGRSEESDTHCDQAETTALARGEHFPLLGIWHVRAQRYVREGRLAEACDLFVKIEETTHRLGIGEPCTVPWARHAITTYLSCGRFEDASRVVRWLERSAEGLSCRWPRIAAAAGRATLAEHCGDPVHADHHFVAALALHDQVPLPLERVETLLQYGGFLRRRHETARARPLLAEALELSEGCGAHWLTGQVHEELTVAGGRRRRGHGKREQLTAQEKRVASLAASGWSNREIACQLSLSVNTIGTHLKSIYAKRGIHTRRQLMAIEPGHLR